MNEQSPNIKASELVTLPEGLGDTLIETFLFPVEGGRARVFGLVQINQRNADNAPQTPEVLRGVIRITRAHLDQARGAMAGDANIPRRFEVMLSDLNAALAAHMQGSSTFPIAGFEAIIGVVTDHQLFVSGIGNLNALFLHKTAERRFVIYELHAQFRVESEVTWEKPFVTVLDGEVHPGDIFYVATRTPASAIALTDLQDILITLPPASALQRIRQFLPYDAEYGALCFSRTEEEHGGPPKKTNPIASITQLGAMKHETADLLGEEGSDVTGFIRRAVAYVSGKLASPGSRGYKSMLKRVLRALVQVLGILLIGIMQLLRTIVKTTWTLLQRIFDASRKRESGARRAPLSLNRHIRTLRALPRTQKYLIGGACGLIALLIVSLVFMGHASERKNAEETFATTASRIEEKTSAAEASLIYSDTEKARGLLTEAAALLETLPSDSKNHEERIATLSQGLTALQNDIRHITPVTPTTVATLAAGETGLAAMASVQGALYAFAMDGELFRVNELEHQISKQGATNTAITNVTVATEENTNLLFIDGAKHLGHADLSAATLKTISSGVDGMASAEDLVTYNSALYVLSAASQQVVKMRPQGDGYEAGTPWISARSSDLTSARALAIDGNVFILTTNDVIEYKSGREVTWTHDPIEPALKNPVDIWTSLESSYLYILDSGEGRVIVYNKATGGIVTQYVSDALKGSIGFTVRESDKQILVALPSAVVALTATHLLQ